MKYLRYQLKLEYIFNNPRCGWMLCCPKCDKVLFSGSPESPKPTGGFCDCDNKD